MQSKIEKTFEAGTWVVAKLSFGERILKMEVDGTYCDIIRPVQEVDFETIEVSVWVGGKLIFEGLRKDFKGKHFIFPIF
jgi:hypothetical protein